MPSLNFLDLPGEVHLQIGRLEMPSEMGGLILSSQLIRNAYSRPFYHTIAFRGTKADLMGDLWASIYQLMPSTVRPSLY
jgi:hypothetical protein